MDIAGYVALGSVVGGVLTAFGAMVINILRAKAGIQQQSRKDAISEWQQIAERLQHDVNEDRARMNQLATQNIQQADQIAKLQESRANDLVESHRREQECLKECGQLRADLIRAEGAIKQLQKGIPLQEMIGIMVANDKGTILAYSPSLTPILHYIPQEVVGKDVSMFVPERFRPDHQIGLRRVRELGQEPWPEKTIHTFALTKDGHEVPVAITLKGVLSGAEPSSPLLICATIRERTGVKKESPGKAGE
jgi:PAS domain S-box-containing protein